MARPCTATQSTTLARTLSPFAALTKSARAFSIATMSTSPLVTRASAAPVVAVFARRASPALSSSSSPLVGGNHSISTVIGANASTTPSSSSRRSTTTCQISNTRGFATERDADLRSNEEANSSSGSGSSNNNGGRKKDSTNNERSRAKNSSTFMYMTAVAIFTVGASYAAVPLYRLFCQVTGYGGTVVDGKATAEGDTLSKLLALRKTETKEKPAIPNQRTVTVHFNADVSTRLGWEFEPAQSSVRLKFGETTLAFYTAKNNTRTPITGVATYNVTPMKAGLYFNKIQCFCFDEQRLRAGEEIDMPVFFFLDPEMADDPRMDEVTEVTLSYTFFKSEDQMDGDAEDVADDE
jgi:cytochrome c oxidase assembly protein subunit 11